MPFIQTKDGQHIHYKDMGSGRPVVLIHGWPLSGDMWEYQSLAFLEAGYRVITYDRRGFGQSSHPFGGYNYDNFAHDLATLLRECHVENCTLIGFSMGGGEIARYLSLYGTARVRSVGLLASVVPFLLKTPDNPLGVDKSLFDDAKAEIRRDRFHYLAEFQKIFYGMGVVSKPVSQALLDWSFTLAIMASPSATLDCVDAFSQTDFRQDLKAFTIPTLIIHGTGDKTVPHNSTGKRAAEAIPNAIYREYEGAPHGLFATHAASVNRDFLEFLKR